MQDGFCTWIRATEPQSLTKNVTKLPRCVTSLCRNRLKTRDALPDFDTHARRKSRRQGCLIDLVELGRIEKLLGVAPIDALFDEDIEQVGIDMAAFLEAGHDAHGLG